MTRMTAVNRVPLADTMPPASVSQAIHHPLQARILRERAKPLGVPVLIHAGSEKQEIDYLEFLVRVLNSKFPAAPA